MKLSALLFSIYLVFFSLNLISDESKKESPESKIILVEELPCILDEERTLDKEVTRKIETEKDFSKKLLDSDSICKSNNSSSNTAPNSSSPNDIQNYISASSSNQAEESGETNEGNNNSNKKMSEENNNSESSKSKDLKLERCAQNLNLTGEVEKNIIDEIGKTNDENVKKALLKELSNRSSKSVEVIENQCFN
tara:strand:+ start:120 stop:701 length:582 start_codon:yes stop_codon:yes gene_type:complete